MEKVLIITYYWPPSGGAGVQRWLKFSKYLPEFGWEPIILTVDPLFATYPVTDDSLKDELSSLLKVHKTPATDYFSLYKKDKTKIPSAGFANSVDNTLKGKFLRFIRGNFFIPDPRRGWNKFAFKKACEIIETEGIKHVITTSPPHSTQLIGTNIKKKYPDINWVADLRDPWTDIYYYSHFYPSLISKMFDSRLEKKVLKKADRIITVGESLKALFSLKIKGIAQKTEVITNGYDEADFKDVKANEPARFTLTYVGTLSDIYPVDSLLAALKNLVSEGKDFVLRFVGSVSENARKLIVSAIPFTSVEFISHVTHNEAIRYMLNSSVLILIIPSHASNKSILTGKIFEYIATGKPVLCLGPVDGDAAKIISITGNGAIFGYHDKSGISDYFSEFETKRLNTINPAINQFSRRELTAKLVDIISRED
jgi:glycosyltransferase involved in cell wall biosynthesis